jgi:DNA-binding PadR family transcriptional regulator
MVEPTDTPRSSPLGLIVLWLLVEEPRHVYRMQKLIESQGKDRVVNVGSRASLYQTVERLERLGLVEVHETVRSKRHPDRTVYAVTERGRGVAQVWLRQMLTTTEGEFPEFVTAISMLFALDPEDARAQLELRASRLRAQLAEAVSELADNPDLPRLFLLEEEYRRSVLEAELTWIDGVVEDLRAGRLTWSEQWLREMAATFNPTENNEEER